MLILQEIRVLEKLLKQMTSSLKVGFIFLTLTLAMLEDKKNLNVDSTKKLYDSIPGYKKKAKMYELTKVKADLAEQVAESKRKDLNMSVE